MNQQCPHLFEECNAQHSESSWLMSQKTQLRAFLPSRIQPANLVSWDLAGITKVLYHTIPLLCMMLALHSVHTMYLYLKIIKVSRSSAFCRYDYDDVMSKQARTHRLKTTFELSWQQHRRRQETPSSFSLPTKEDVDRPPSFALFIRPRIHRRQWYKSHLPLPPPQNFW